MFSHSCQPRILDSVPVAHPLHGRDLRTLSDGNLAEGGAHAILPGFERVKSYLGRSYGEHPEINDLVSSAFRRVTRILIQRIRIERLSGQGDPSVEIQDEILDAITLAFVHMVGVFDAIALVNGLLDGQTNYSHMGWQKRNFRGKLRQAVPEAVALMEPQADGGRFLRAVMDFRNTIHRRMPDPASSGRAGGNSTLRYATILLERRSHGEILDSFQAAGWTNSFGVDLAGDSYLILRPEAVVSLMLNDGIPLINKLMNVTPIETLCTHRIALDPDKTLYPPQLKEYAVEYLGLTHLTEAR